MSPLVDFVRNNLLLFAVALISGAMLLWPLFRRTAGGPWVTPAQATHLINREDALVVDVRDPGEYAAGHILGAKNVPLARIDERAAKAVAALKTQGFSRVVNLSGGIGAWQQAGLPVEK